MPAPTLYASTDASAPTLSGTVGEFVALLDAILRTGYGSKAGAGWTKPYTSTNAAAFLQGGSNALYLQVDDNGPGTGGAREARMSGWVTMSAYNTGTNQFPTSALVSVLVPCRKSTTADSTTRPWKAAADSRTCHLWIKTGDQSASWVMYSFGDFYSFKPGDTRKFQIIGSAVETAGGPITSHPAARTRLISDTAAGGHWIPSVWTNVGGATCFNPCGDHGFGTGSGATGDLIGTLGFPNGPDGGLYVSPIRMLEGTTPSASFLGTPHVRGRLRGLWHAAHAVSNFADDEDFPGAGEYAGKTLRIIKPIIGSGAATSMVILETSAWDTSS